MSMALSLNRRPAGTRGFTLLELIAVIAVTSIVAVSGLGASATIRSAHRLEADRDRVVAFLSATKRRSYLQQTATSLSIDVDSDTVTADLGGGRSESISLSGSSDILSAGNRESIRFFANGFADSATIRMAVLGSNGTATRNVVINSRGEIR